MELHVVFMGYGQMTSELEMDGRDFLRGFTEFGVSGGTKHTLLCTARSRWRFLELTAGLAVLRKSNLGFFSFHEHAWAAFVSNSIAAKSPMNTSNRSHQFLSAKEGEVLPLIS